MPEGAAIDDAVAKAEWQFGGRRRGDASARPAPRAQRYTVISVDDHVVEPPDMFVGRIPAKYVDEAPGVVEHDGGTQAWIFHGELFPNVAFK